MTAIAELMRNGGLPAFIAEQSQVISPPIAGFDERWGWPRDHVVETSPQVTQVGHLRTRAEPSAAARARHRVLQLAGVDLRDAAFEALHPRLPVGVPGGGRFVSKLLGLPAGLFDWFRSPRHRASVEGELQRQATLAPRSMRGLTGLSLDTPDSDDGKMFLSKASPNALARVIGPPGNKAIAFNPYWIANTDVVHEVYHRRAESGWFAPTATDSAIASVTAHEFGHVVERHLRDGKGNMPPEAAQALIPALADELGIDHPDVSNGITHADLESWWKDNADTVKDMVSGYAADAFHEALAEIWAEWSTMGDDARPHIRVLGQLLYDLVEGEDHL